jgi:hypothetical protein
MNFLLLDKSKCDFQLKKITQYSKNGIVRVFMERKKENLSVCWSFTFLSVFPSVFTFFSSVSFSLYLSYCQLVIVIISTLRDIATVFVSIKCISPRKQRKQTKRGKSKSKSCGSVSQPFFVHRTLPNFRCKSFIDFMRGILAK